MPGLLDFFADPDAQEQMRQRALALAQQGARGVTTGLLGAPVDIANMALANVGGDKPVMGSQWIGDKLSGMGLLAPPPKDIGESGAEFLGGMVNPPSGLLGGAGKALIAFHGSPHLFDRFSMSRIGTGEGAQSRGYGLYFAEEPKVAQTYAGPGTTIGGARFENKLTERMTQAQDAGRYGEAMALEDLLINRSPIKAAQRFTVENGYTADRVAEAQKTIAALAPKFKESNVYKVDIPDEQVAKMLDWDKPLNQQPVNVQAVLKDVMPPQIVDGLQLVGGGNLRVVDNPDFGRKFFLEMGGSRFPLTDKEVTNLIGSGIDGGSLYQSLKTQYGSDKNVSAYLYSKGIPGLKYWDGGSRESGKGTSNFVTFHDQIKMLGRE